MCYYFFRFERENENKLENYLKAEFSSNLASLWFNFRLKMIGQALLFSISFISVFIHQWNFTNAGLCLLNIYLISTFKNNVHIIFAIAYYVTN